MREQTFDFAAVDCVHDFLGAVAWLGKFFRLDAPDAGYVFTGRRIGERTLTWKLVAFLPMLASTLAVSLAGNHRWPGTFAADVAGGKSDIDHRQTVLYAFGLMLQSAGVHHDGALRFADPARGLLDRFGWHAGHIGSTLRRSHCLTDSATALEPGGVLAR